MREKILSFLFNSKEYISGEIISSELGISRTAVWKHIKKLRDEGFVIDSVTNKGYKLVEAPELLIEEEILMYLKTGELGRKMLHFDSINSTNSEAKKLAEEGMKSGTVIISEEQVAGKGRLGREWMSPKYKGLWMSVILRPDIDPAKTSLITQIAGAAVILALKKFGIDAGIKWPNDIILDKKKAAGILTEMSSEIRSINYVILGIGINVNQEPDDFPGNISDTATSLKIYSGKNISRAELCAEILNNLEFLYNDFTENNTAVKSIDICRNHSVLLNKEVVIHRMGKEYTGIAVALNSNGELVIKKANGEMEYIFSGEVSVRGKTGYAE